MSGIINLSVGIQSAATPRTSFGIPLILDFENVKGVMGVPALKTYSSLDEMKADGWKVYHAAYKMAVSLLAQQPRVVKFKVWGMATPGSGSHTVTTDLDDLLAVDKDWYLLLSTSRAQQDLEDIAAWAEQASSRCFFVACTNDAGAKAAGESVLSALFNADNSRTLPLYQDATKQTGRIYVDKLFVSGQKFNCKVNGVAITEVDFPAAPNDNHNAMMNAIAAELQASTPIDVCSVGTSTSKPLGLGKYDYIEFPAADVLVDILITDAYFTGGMAPRPTARVVETVASSKPADAALAGKVLPEDPGSASWAFKTLKGVTADTLSTSERGYIEAQRGNWYSTELGFDISFPGTCAAESSPGTPYFADQIQLCDAIESELQTGLMEVLNKAKKVPYTDQGVGAFLAVFKRVEEKYIGSGALVKKSFDSSYTVPSVASQAPSDVSNRIYRGLKASWQTSGGINVVASFAVTLQA